MDKVSKQAKVARIRGGIGAESPTDHGEEATDIALSRIPICRPRLPEFARMAKYARQLDESRWYTNYGPLHELLRLRLAEHFGLDHAMAGLASSGTAAITGLLLATAGRAGAARPLCVCPSYTFVATAVAAQSCGFTPFFADIDRQTLALSPEDVAALPEIGRVGAVVVVAPFGMMVDLAPWHDFSARTRIPVIVDAAACFDTVRPDAIRKSAVPVAVSLHATKTFSSAEGGLILCSDTDVVQRANKALNFGFEIARISEGPSLNGKMSEYHAMVGLADLEGWPEKRARFSGGTP